MRLIIAEKHSVGQAIAQALGGHAEKHDGYIEVGGDLVTWAQGHLVDLAAPDEYKNHDWGKWSLDTLPIDPTPDWQWKVSRDKGADRQYKVVAGLMRRGDVDMLVDACDPDREGEAIFRRIVTHVGVSKPMRRLWVASLEEDAIRDALASMKDETEYQGLADSAMIRAKADWLIGMNASRAYSLVYNARFTVGRVQTPTLAMIVDRDRRIAGHVAQPYWKVVAPMGGWKLTGERLDKREDAETLLRIVNSDDFTFMILKADRKQQHDAPPRLYDLTGLQKDMSRLHGLTAARYVHDVTNVVANIDPHWCEKHPDEGRLLSEGECRFTSRSDQPVSIGWHAIEHDGPQEDQDDNDETAGNIIPANLVTGVSIAPVPQCGATLSEGQTKPPKPFSEATLLAAMEHASRWVEDNELKAALDDDESHSGGIGTPATRANIIEQLVHSGYVDRKGKQLRSTEQGRSLIDVVATKLKDVALTAGMERRLSEVEHNHADPAQVETEFRDLAVRIPADAQTAVRQDHVQTKTRNTESFGPCPRCGKPVIKSGKVFQCSTNRREKQSDGTWKATEGCGWRAWTTVAGKTVTDSAIRRLLAGQKVSLKGFTSKKGNKFDASLVIDKDRGVIFDFGNKH